MAELYEDLLKDSSESFEDGNYFLVTILDLELGETYPLQFKWKYKDGTFGKDWSAVYNITTPIKSNPNDPRLQSGDVVGGAGFIKVTWDGNDASGNPLTDIDRIDVHISGTSFGDGTKPAGSFKLSGTQTFSAEPGIYIVQLKAVTVNGATSFFSTARTVTVTSAAEPIESPTNPNGFTSRRILAGIEVSWAGTYANGTFSGFEAIKVYAGTSASATGGTYTEVGVLTGNNVKNTIIVPVDGTYVVYGQPTYIHAAAVNKNGTVGTIQANVTNQSLGPGKATDADINDGAVVISKLASDVLTVGNLKAGDINATSYIRAGTAASARVEISSTTVGSVLPGLTVYDSSGTQLLRAPLTGGLTINGGGTFSGNLSAAGGTFTGTLSAATGSFSGTITASGGTIGGIIIAADAIQNGATSGASTFRLDSSGKARFGASGGNSIIIDPSIGIFQSTNGNSANGNFTLNATGSSTISGWTIGTNQISKGTTILNSSATNGYIQIGSGTSFFKVSSEGLQLGNETFGSAPFRVAPDGTLNATGATISGTLTAGSGSSIGGWSITTGTISKSSSYTDWAGNPQTLTTTLNSNSSITLSSTSSPNAIINDISSVDNLLKVNHANANTVIGPGQIEIGTTQSFLNILPTKLVTWVSAGSKDINIKWSGGNTDPAAGIGTESVSPARIKWWNYASSGGEAGQRLANLWPNRDISPSSYRVLMVDTGGLQYLGPILYFSTTQATTPNNGTGEDGDLYFTTA